MAAQNYPAAQRQVPAVALLILLYISLLLSSCTTSLSPLTQNDKDIVFREALVGTWEAYDGNWNENPSYAVVQKGEGSFYRIMAVGSPFGHLSNVDHDTVYLQGRLVQVEGHLFIDCVPDDKHPSFRRISEYGRMGTTPVHFICPLVFRNQDEVLEMWRLETGEELREILKQKKVSFYSQSDETILLMEPTANLRKLMTALIKEDKPGTWSRTMLVRPDPGATDSNRVVMGNSRRDTLPGPELEKH